LAGLGDVGGATRELERAVALDPGNPTARFNLAILLASAGEHRLAVIHFAAATAARPEDEEAWLGEAASWIALRDFGRAADRLALAGGTLPESGRIALGLARLLAAAPEVAVRDGERALDLAQRVFDAQRSADHAVVVSLALRELGRCDAAREWLEGLIAQGEASGDVATLRAERARLGETTPCRP
jgi:tetratricopeptide (TPR) repeat protein